MASVSSTINSRIDNLNYSTPEDLESFKDEVQDSIDELEAKVISSGKLDWNNKVNTKPVGSGKAYTAVTPCVYIACMSAPSHSDEGYLYVNGIKHTTVNRQDGYNQNVSVYLPLDTGDSIYWSKSLGSVISAIVPFKGVS